MCVCVCVCLSLSLSLFLTLSLSVFLCLSLSPSFSLSLTHTPQGATSVVVTADGGFRTGRTTSPPDSRAWTPSTPTATGWFRTKTCRLMTERTSSGTCTTSTSAGQRSVSVLLPSPGPVLCPLPWDTGQSPFSYLPLGLCCVPCLGTQVSLRSLTFPWACVVSPALGQRSVSVLLLFPRPVFCPLPWDKVLFTALRQRSVFCPLPWDKVLFTALRQRSVFCSLPWDKGQCFLHCPGAKVSVLTAALVQRSVFCSLPWDKGQCFVPCPGPKVSILFTALGQRSVSNCFAPCLGVKVNQCFVSCLGTKVSKFVLFLPWDKDQSGVLCPCPMREVIPRARSDL